MHEDENILYFNEYSGNVAFSCNEMGVLKIDLNNISLHNNFDEDDSDTIILIRLLAWHIKFEKRKELKKYKRRILKNYRWKINGNSVASQKKVGLMDYKMRKNKIDPMLIEDL